MYSTCLFCNKRLGTNEVIEPFPVGRRLAFDAAKGRLWVVCHTCERWNLSPFDERWEAVEDCELRFRDARQRVCSDNIGLARLDEGLELVRIGEALRPEFAAWRYGDQFGRRRRRAILTGSAVGVAIAGVAAGSVALGAAAPASYWLIRAAERLVKQIKDRRLIARIPGDGGETLTVRGKHLDTLRLHPDLVGEEGWSLELLHANGRTILTGPHAVNATGLLMPKINKSGAPQRRVLRAVKRIEAFDDPVSYLLAAAHVADAKAPGEKVIAKLPVETRLAIEMAANEENERIAMEGDLALLELDWKEAEEIAAIADSLLVPPEVEEQFQQMRRKVDESGA